MGFLQKDCPSESAAHLKLSVCPWLKHYAAFGPWHSSPICCPVGGLGVRAQQGAYKGAPQMARRFVGERQRGKLVVARDGEAFYADRGLPQFALFLISFYFGFINLK
jgi:hypothetical protein